MGGMTTMAVSEARLPTVPTKATTKGRITGGSVAQLILEQGHNQAGLLAHADGQGHGDDQAQGGEAGKVLEHVLQEPDQAGAGDGVLDGYHLFGGGG